MRIKPLKRNPSNVIRKVLEARQAKVLQINLNLNVLKRAAAAEEARRTSNASSTSGT